VQQKFIVQSFFRLAYNGGIKTGQAHLGLIDLDASFIAAVTLLEWVKIRNLKKE